MNRPLYFLMLTLTCIATARAQVTRDFAVDLKADVSPIVPHITLSWSLRQNANISAQKIYRRLKGDPTWVLQANLTTSDTGWADSSAVPGVEYEYWMQRSYTTISPNVAIGYIAAGYNLPMVEDRGKILLVVDDTMLTPLAPEIDQLKLDLTADGWTVVSIPVARRDSLTDVTAVADTKALIKAAYDEDPTRVKMAYVLGHVPVPYAGVQAPDGHSNHVGAWSADGFYGDMNGSWTDSTQNNTSSTETRIHNIPGDGKLDQSTIPSPLEIMVGRVDLRNMQRAPATNVTEVALLRRYLRKAHDFKVKQGAYANLERRVLIRDGFGNFSGESFMRTGWAWGFTGVGRPPEVNYDEAPSGDWWTLASANDYLMANGNGGGSYETCGSVGNTADFGRRPFRAAFVSLFGSYFGDWDVTNNLMKAPLAGNATGDGLGLCCFWAGRPTFFMHSMATGETLGYAIRQSINSQFSSISNPVYTPINFPGGGTHLGLMGDPALRLHVVEPPQHLVASSSNGSVNLAWAASGEANLLGYHVYRATSAYGPFARLTPSPLATPSFTDSTGSSGTSYSYMVRTLKMESSPGGTYANLSQGEMISLAVATGAAGIPLNPTGLTVAQASSVSAQLSWRDNASDETGYRVERKSGPSGSFSLLTTLPANTTSCTDPGPFSANETYYYRAFATNGAGDSAPSSGASFDAVPGFFEFASTMTKVSKSVSSATIPVKRFGGKSGVVTVNYATSNTSALAGTHYTTTNGTLTWADGESGEKNITVPITNTALPQNPKQFRLTLSSPSSGTGIGTYNAISVLIEDPAATLPTPWAQTVIGAVTDSSPAVQAEGAISSTTVGGTGLATAATSEAGQFIYQTRSGDGVLTAQVAAASPAQSGARYAVMIRENFTSGGALMAGTSTSSSTGEGTKMLYRTTSSGTAVFAGAVTAQVAPRWVRITRAGNSFTSESSADGVNWNTHGTATVVMAPTAQWGLFHHSDDRSGTTYSGNYQVVPFQNISFTTISGPSAPGTLTATQPSPGRVTLSWGAATLAAGYRLERRVENGIFTQIIDLPSGTLTFNDDQTGADTAYEYRIYAFNGSGNGPLSNTIQVTTQPGDIYALIDGSLTSNADASIKGGSPSSNSGSESQLSVSGLSSTATTATTAKSYFRFDVTGMPTLKTAAVRLCVSDLKDFAQTGYNFTAQLRFLPDAADSWSENSITWANAPNNNTATSSFLTGTALVSTLSITPASMPSIGSILQLDASAAQINANRGADNFVTYAMNATTPSATIYFASKEHPSLPPPSLEVTYASPLPTRPSFLIVSEGSGNNLDLAWLDNSSTETGFEIERREAGGTFAPLITLAAGTTTYTDASTLNGATYEYRVRALSTGGNSVWSTVVAATAGGSTGPLTGFANGYSAWINYSGTAFEEDAAPLADPDGDGVPNLLEYALGTVADIGNSGTNTHAGSVEIDGQQHLTLTFQRRLDATDVSLTVEASSSLVGPWLALDPLQPQNQVSAQKDLPSAGWQTLTILDPVPNEISAPRFMRLRATQR